MNEEEVSATMENEAGEITLTSQEFHAGDAGGQVSTTTELRLRTRLDPEKLKAKIGHRLGKEDYDVLLTGKTRVLMPDGRPLCVYLPRYIPEDILDSSYETLHSLRAEGMTDNRGPASGYI